MNLRNELKAARERVIERPASTEAAAILDELVALAYAYGPTAAGPWLVVRTEFHGGGVVSRHRSAAAAIKRRRAIPAGGCQCGCARVTLGRVRVAVDPEFGLDEFWEAIDEYLPAVAAALRDGGQVTIDGDTWRAIRRLPGFSAGPAHAPTALVLEGVNT